MIKKILFIILTIFIGALGRLIPHIPNLTPLLSIGFISGRIMNRWLSIIVMLFTVFLSDVFLAYWHHYPILGFWSLFTYSGILGITLLGSVCCVENRIFSSILWMVFGAIGFWLWTNLGTWLVSGIYPHSLSGFLNCFVMALPFLQTQIIGSVLWLFIFLLGLQYRWSILRLASLVTRY